MRKKIEVEALLEKIGSICDEIEALNDGYKKIAESLKNELDSYVEIMIEHAKSANESYYKMLSDLDNKTVWSEASCLAYAMAHPIEDSEEPEPEEPEEYNLGKKDTGRKINEVGANIILEMKENLKEKCKQTWETYDAFERIKGVDYFMTQKYLTKWVTYQDLYKEFFGEEVQY
jgi:hypothetical protein